MNSFRQLIETCCDRRESALLRAASSFGSAEFLRGNPNTRDVTRLDDAALRTALGLRLGASVATPGKCQCGTQLDPQGDHALTCKMGPGRGARHRLLNQSLRNLLLEAGIPSQLEPVGLIRNDGKLPDGATVLPFKNGRILCWDATCIHSLAASWIPFSSVESGSAAREAESRKTLKYESLQQRCDFAPFAVETLGPLGPSAMDLLRSLADRSQNLGRRKGALARSLRRVSAVVQLGNAACILHAHSSVTEVAPPPLGHLISNIHPSLRSFASPGDPYCQGSI